LDQGSALHSTIGESMPRQRTQTQHFDVIKDGANDSTRLNKVIKKKPVVVAKKTIKKTTKKAAATATKPKKVAKSQCFGRRVCDSGVRPLSVLTVLA